MIKKYTATIELCLIVNDEKTKNITLEQIETKLDEQARDIAEDRGAKIYITNFYEV